jgi:hypothetical protein
MPTKTERLTVDLSGYPELVVIYLGMQVRTLAGVRRLFGLGPQIARAGKAHPDGLLHYDNNIIFSLFPLHIGMRWYWKDLACIERWARSEAHKQWWQQFLRDSGGTGFWHEAYFMQGGMEAIYDDMPRSPLGFLAFAPQLTARDAMFTARGRAGLKGNVPPNPAGTAEADLYK